MSILLANIGNRNLKYNGEFIGKDLKKNDNFFEETKLIYENYETEKSALELNILDVFLQECPEVQKVCLFLTHQPTPFRQDTYYAGLIIRNLLQDRGKEVQIYEYQQDPRDRDASFSFFEAFFLSHQELLDEEVYVSGSGGVPAMKEALNFYAVSSLKNPHIIDVDENTHTLMQSNIAQSYLKKFQKETLISFLEHHNYEGALLYLKSPACLLTSIELERKLRYLSMKYNFDLAKANSYADEQTLGFESLQMINENAEISKLLNQKKQNLIYLLDTIEITYYKWEYTSLLGKLYSLKENFARWKVETLIWEKSTQLTQDQAQSLANQYSAYFNTDKPIIPHRKEHKRDEQLYFLSVNEWNIPDIDFQNLLESLRKLNELRNSSIMAHGFSGISKGELDKQKLLEKIKTLRHKTLGQKKNKYHDAEEAVKKLIQSL